MKKDRVLFSLGVFCLAYWAFDFINIVFLIGKPQYLLWYSTSGLLFTSIALLSRNPFLISTMFTTLFVLESLWSFDFLGKLFFGTHFLGITNYLFEPGYTKKDFIMSLYHLFLPPILLVALRGTKRVYRYSWLSAAAYGSAIALLTFFFVSPTESVNCVHQLTRCRGTLIVIFAAVPYPYHVITTVLLTTFVVFVPTHYITLKVGKKLKWKEI